MPRDRSLSFPGSRAGTWRYALWLMSGMALMTVSLTGCEELVKHDRSRGPVVAPVVDRASASVMQLGTYIESLQRLVQGAPAEQAEILVGAQREYQVAPTPNHQLRYALVLAAPGHAGTDLLRAQQLLRELLAAPETLQPVERAFAVIELQKVDRQLSLSAENQRLQSAGPGRADRERLTTANRRLQLELEENSRLRKELDEARAKLAAIANIEQSINERKSGTEGRSP